MGLFKRKQLLEQLVTITILVTLIPLLLMGIYFHYQNWIYARKQARTTLALQTQLISKTLSDRLIDQWSEKLEVFQLIPSDKLSNEWLSGFGEIWRISDWTGTAADGGVRLIYQSPLEKAPVLSEKSLRQILAHYARSARDPWIYFFSSAGSNGSHYFLIIKKSFSEKTGRSFVAGILPASRVLKDLRYPGTIVSKNSRFVLVDAEGQYQTLSGTPFLKDDLPVVEFALSGNNRPSGRTKTGAKAIPPASRWFTEVSQVDGLPLWVVGQVSKQSIFSPVWRIKLESVFFLLFGILWAIVGALYFAKRITVPLQHFAKSATEIARGDFTQKIDIQSKDEIGRLAKIFNYMMVELRRLNEMNLNQIISERAKTRAIIKNIADGVIVTDPRGKIMMINAAIEDWFQIDERQIVDQPLDRVLPNKHLEELMHEMNQDPELKSFTREFSVKLPGQRKESVFQARSSWVDDHDGHKIAAVTILRDITREKEVDRMKTELVSLVAHELRSPLTSISGFAELLLDTPLNDDSMYEYSKIIKQESDRLSDLVNKFLDLTKIEAGRIDFHPQLLRLNELIEGILYIASSHAQTKGITLDVNLPDEIHPVLADSKLMSEVVLNLLSNAIKYSPSGTKVTISVREEDTGVVIEVSDQGYGIPPKYRERIFDKFFRIKDEAAQDEKGTGLGLSLVKEIVELHRGIILVESEVGRGSTFRVVLPWPHEKDSGDGKAEKRNRMAHPVIH
ncbi:MAG: cell wall metabolism sensor histidine kinase WalK [Calditrichaeota bacterium]|nr:cell wall metabolism sensor histidine kinase WalK [Calditrichota bacterium]